MVCIPLFLLTCHNCLWHTVKLSVFKLIPHLRCALNSWHPVKPCTMFGFRVYLLFWRWVIARKERSPWCKFHQFILPCIFVLAFEFRIVKKSFESRRISPRLLEATAVDTDQDNWTTNRSIFWFSFEKELPWYSSQCKFCRRQKYSKS